MPGKGYIIGKKGSHGCSGYPVVSRDSGRVLGCHETRESALAQLRAVYASEEASKNK
jgi:hypothetical protein